MASPDPFNKWSQYTPSLAQPINVKTLLCMIRTRMYNNWLLFMAGKRKERKVWVRFRVASCWFTDLPIFLHPFLSFFSPLFLWYNFPTFLDSLFRASQTQFFIFFFFFFFFVLFSIYILKSTSILPHCSGYYLKKNWFFFAVISWNGTHPVKE